MPEAALPRPVGLPYVGPPPIPPYYADVAEWPKLSQVARVVVEWRLPRTPAGAVLARRLVAQTVRLVADCGDVVGDVELVAAELAANAVQHGKPVDGKEVDVPSVDDASGWDAHDLFTVRLRVGARAVRVEVEDRGPGFARGETGTNERTPRAEEAPPGACTSGDAAFAESGRGLELVRLLALRCGYSLRKDGVGMVVFADLA